MLRSDRHYPEIRILNLKEELDVKRLLLLFSGAAQVDSLKRLSDDAYVRSRTLDMLRLPSGFIANYVLACRSEGTASVVVETDYYDRDTNVAYVQLSARAFRDYPRRTIRLHFFDTEIRYRDLLDQSKLQRSYLGFCVLSPARPSGHLVRAGTIVKAVLNPPRKCGRLLPRVPTIARMSVNLAGAQLLAIGTGFIEQDDRISACASAALWMSTVVLGRKFNVDTESKSIAEITALATRNSLPASGSGHPPGLGLDQMLWALHCMGYEPILHSADDTTEAVECIYSHIESGIPPILILGFPRTQEASQGSVVWEHHAITAVGYLLDSRRTPKQMPYPDGETSNRNFADDETERFWSSASGLCEDFLIHDDRMGAYLRLRIHESDDELDDDEADIGPRIEVTPEEFLPSEIKSRITKWYDGARLRRIIVPLPPRNVLRFDQAISKGIYILESAFRIHREACGPLPEQPIYRTFLTTSNDFRNHFVQPVRGAKPTVSRELAQWYRGSSFPRYVWVTELLQMTEDPSSSDRELKVIADVTIDPTSSEDGMDFITIHLPHCFLRMNLTDTAKRALERRVAYLPNDPPYSCYQRRAR